MGANPAELEQSWSLELCLAQLWGCSQGCSSQGPHSSPDTAWLGSAGGLLMGSRAGGVVQCESTASPQLPTAESCPCQLILPQHSQAAPRGGAGSGSSEWGWRQLQLCKTRSLLHRPPRRKGLKPSSRCQRSWAEELPSGRGNEVLIPSLAASVLGPQRSSGHQLCQLSSCRPEVALLMELGPT